jgi:hypothetical protein
MRTSLTSRLVHVTEDLRLLRSDLNSLAVALLTDENGISEEASRLLSSVFDRLGGMPALKVDATDGRFYIPAEEA